MKSCSGAVTVIDIDKKIEESGHMVFSIFATETNPSFAYSVGMGLLNLPDVYISGNIKPETQHYLIESVIALLKEKGKDCFGKNLDLLQSKNGTDIPVLILPCTKRFKVIEKTVQAENYYDVKQIPRITRLKNDPDGKYAKYHYVQIIWPDENNYFSIQSEFNKLIKQDLFVGVSEIRKLIFQ